MHSRATILLSLFAPGALGLLGLDLGGILNDALKVIDGDGSPKANPPFDAKSQLVDVSGDHAWQAPGPNDARGPCPGLNALANHNYIPRNGFADITTFISGTAAGFGMSTDLSAILAVYGAVFDGALVGWSIGGTEHSGIGGSHNNYETDSSPMRGDLNQWGSNTNLIISQFQELYDMQPDAATANYDLNVIAQFRKKRFDESIAKNPNFFYGPFSGPEVSAAAFTFIYRFMANHTAEHPAGILNKEVLKSFMSISGPEDNLQWTPGHERFPENWYRRNDDDRYSLAGIGSDMPTLTAYDPRIGQPGCNTGKVNDYHLINVTDLSNGAYSQQDLVSKPLCFGIAVANNLADALPAVNFVVGELLLPVQNALGCRTVPSLNESVYDACPGYSTYGGPTGPIASGAIQN